MHAFLEFLKAGGPWGVLALSTIESAGIPNPGGTDALLLFLVITDPGIAWACAALATIGSLAGSAVFYRIVRKGGELYLDKRTGSSRNLLLFRRWFLRYGLSTVFISALLPIPVMPLKFFALCGAAVGVPMSRFLLIIALARVPRYFALAYLGVQLGSNSSAWLKSHVWHMVVFAAILAVLLYVVVRFSDRSKMEGQATQLL